VNVGKRRRGPGRPYKKGQSGNPAGRPPLDPAVRKLKKITNGSVERVGYRVFRMSKAELQAWISAPERTALDLMIGSIAVETIKTGDHRKAMFLLDRICGKVPNPVEVTGADGEPLTGPQVLISLPDNGRK
jgi:hypothetical protein